jgi:hypothetical protein
MGSVVRFSVLFYAAAAAVGCVAGALLYLVALVSGSLPHIEESVRLFLPGMRLTPARLLPIALVLATTQVVVGTTVNVVAASLYNLVADLGAGIELVVTGPKPEPQLGAEAIDSESTEYCLSPALSAS